MKKWSGRQDSNLRLLGPKPSALPGCATPRSIEEGMEKVDLFGLCQTGMLA